jgi:hypothetical protein
VAHPKVRRARCLVLQRVTGVSDKQAVGSTLLLRMISTGS